MSEVDPFAQARQTLVATISHPRTKHRRWHQSLLLYSTEEDWSTFLMQVVRAYEEALGAIVHDVSTAERALTAGLEAWL